MPRLRRPFLLLALFAFAGCAAGDDSSGGKAGGAGAAGSDGGGGSDTSVDVAQDGTSFDAPTDNKLTPDTGCATAFYEAKQAPAAMLATLDRSSSMAQGMKWVAAANAIVNAADQDIFDTMWLGLYAAPSATKAGPACIFGLPVACQAPAFPQVDLEVAGSKKSGDPGGVRNKIKTWLGANNPDQGIGDASPLYDAIQASILSLQGWKEKGKRILLVVTDGTISCNQFSNRPGFPDCNNCDHDWEDPNNIVKLLSDANKDGQKPVETFVVGVPGADTKPGSCDAPPYFMRLALSAMAYAGSPTNVPPTCTGTTFTKSGPEPTEACHFDMTKGNFDSQKLAEIITAIRGKTLGCVFDLPVPEAGTIDKGKVNVQVAIGDGGAVDVLRRKDPKDACANDGCWDYTPDDKVELIGKACVDLKAAPNAKVQIVVGCETKLK